MSARRVLVVAYNFPPSGSVGTMRTVRIVERLAGEGWEVTVLTPTPSTYDPSDPVDPGLTKRIPAAVQIIQAPVLRPIAGAVRAVRRVAPRAPAAPAAAATPAATASPPARRSWARRTLDAVDFVTGIPDRESGWIAPAVARGMAWAQRGQPHLIYSTGPPWSAQLAGFLLAKGLGRPWVADFRDPWARGPWRENLSPALLRAWQKLERRVVGRADAVVFVTRRARDEFAAFYGPALAAKMHVVPNGCDVEEFAALPPPALDPFVLLHAGSLYGARNPLTLVRAIGAAVARGAIDPHRFRLRLLGISALTPDVAAEMARLGLDDVVEVVPRVTRRASLDAIASASALLLLQPGHALSVPAKAYEYLASGRPILAIADDGETADVVREAGAGVVASSQDVAGLERALLHVMAMASRARVQPPRSHYDGSARAAEVVALLDRFVPGVAVTAAEPLIAPTAGGRDRA